MKDLEKELKFRREASAVKRCHNMPWHGDYTVGQHSFDMLMIYFTYCKEPKMQVVKAMAFHDMAERLVGDSPYPVKAYDREFRNRLHVIEQRVNKAHGFEVDLDDPEDIKWLHAADMLEFYLACVDQYHLGNVNVFTTMLKVSDWWGKNQDQIPAELQGSLGMEEPRLPDDYPEPNE